MSTAAIMMVKDEIDIIRPALEHLAYHVDEIYVLENGSTDGTASVVQDFGDPVTFRRDDDVAYYQSKKMSKAAEKALHAGHQWVIPVDADELWYVAADYERRIADFLSGQAPDVHMVTAELYNHVPTGADNGKLSPFERILYRKTQPGALPKVACRLHDSLIIDAGNHSARYSGPSLTVGGLCIRHFSWRSPSQYVRKIRNGIVAYDATRLHPDVGKHWRMWENLYSEYTMKEIAAHKTLPPDQALEEHFYQWFYSEHPQLDRTLMRDPGAGEMSDDERNIFCDGERTTVVLIGKYWVCQLCGIGVWRERGKEETADRREGGPRLPESDRVQIHVP